MMQELRYVRPANLPDVIEVEGLDGHRYSNPRASAPAPATRLANRQKRRAKASASKRKGKTR